MTNSVWKSDICRNHLKKNRHLDKNNVLLESQHCLLLKEIAPHKPKGSLQKCHLYAVKVIQIIKVLQSGFQQNSPSSL